MISTTQENPCGGHPSPLVLTEVNRNDVGHYSCAARNIAGEGERSEGIFLDVQCKNWETSLLISSGGIILYLLTADLPDVAEVLLEGEPVKGADAQLSCFLENPGNPFATEFLWMK